jgi:competence protein ComEA
LPKFAIKPTFEEFFSMFKKLFAFFASMTVAMAFAAVDVNKATPAELDGVKGIGPVISAKIIDERKKGNFKSWEDFIERVKGIGEGNAAKFSAEGLTVAGAGFKGVAAAPAKAASAAPAKADARPAAATTAPATSAPAKADAKADAKPAAPAAASAAPAMAKDDKKDPKADAKMKKDEAAKAKADEKTAKADAAKAKADAKPAAKDDKKTDAKADAAKPAASAAKK